MALDSPTLEDTSAGRAGDLLLRKEERIGNGKLQIENRELAQGLIDCRAARQLNNLPFSFFNF